jgi:hypothetical protein
MTEHGGVKLDWQQVREIRTRHADGERDLHLKYGMSPQAIQEIVEGLRWKNDPADQDESVLNTALWRESPLYPGYKVTADGQVMGLRGAILKQRPGNAGYSIVSISVEGRSFRRTWAYVHRMVCSAFHGMPPTPLHEVRHLDGDPSNNAPGNLAWGTHAENMRDMVRHGRGTQGERHGNALLDDEIVLAVRADWATGKWTQADLCYIHDLGATAVWGIVHGYTWKHLLDDDEAVS